MSAKIGGRHKHLFQKKEFAREKSHKKYQKAFEWYTDLLKKEQKYGLTKWISKTKIKADARLKKFGITASMMTKHLEKKGLKDLLSQ